MDYPDSLWAHLGGDADTDVTTTSEVDEWMRKQLEEAEAANLDLSPVDNEPLSETTWNSMARRAILRRTATGEPEYIEAARRVLSSKAYEMVDGALLDLFSASAVVGVYDALGTEMQTKMGALDLPRAIDLSFKAINRGRNIARRGSRKTAKSARDVAVGDVISGPGSGYSPSGTDHGTVSKVDSTSSPGTVYIYFGDHGPPADLIFNHGDPVTISSESARRQAGAPTIMGKDDALKSAPKEEQDAYWAFVSQGAADSDSGWYVPLSFSSWRSGYWDESKSAPSYAPGMPPMASMRQGSRKRAVASDKCPECGAHMDDVYDNGDTLRAHCGSCGWSGTKRRDEPRGGARKRAAAPTTGERMACEKCDQDIEYWEGHGWIDRGGNKSCDSGGEHTPYDPEGRFASRKRAQDDADLYDPVGNRATDGGSGDHDEDELYDDWVHDEESADREADQRYERDVQSYFKVPESELKWTGS